MIQMLQLGLYRGLSLDHRPQTKRHYKTEMNSLCGSVKAAHYDTSFKITRLQRCHRCLCSVSQAYLGLMSGALAVCLLSFSAFPPPYLRSFPQSPALSFKSSLSRVSEALCLPVFPFFHPLPYTENSHVLTRLSDTSVCVGVRSDQTCRRRLYAHSDTQWCTPRQRVPSDSPRGTC